MNFEKMLGYQVFKNHNWNLFQYSSSLSFHASFCNCYGTYTFFNVLGPV